MLGLSVHVDFTILVTSNIPGGGTKSTLETTEGVIQNGQSRETGKLGYTRRRQGYIY